MLSKLHRTSDINALYKAVRRDAPEQVDVLVQETKGVVEHIDTEHNAVELRSAVSWQVGQPIYHDGQELLVNHCESDKVVAR